MRQVEHAERAVRFPEPFDDKPKRSVGDHIDRVNFSMVLSAADSAYQNNQQYQIEQDFQLPCRPAQAAASWEKQPLAAAADNAVDTGAHHRADDTWGK